MRILVTGNEVMAPGRRRRARIEIYDANSYMLRGLVARDGGVLEAHHRLGDDPDAIRDALLAPGADVILVSGGSSVGSEDHAPRLLAEVGELAIHGVAMRPSSPAGVGRIGATLVFLLPGNPVSCLCAYDFFAGRAIRLRGGRPRDWPHRTRALRGRPQDRLRDRPRRLLPRPHRRRRGRADRAERRVDPVVDDARRRLRDRARGKRGLRARHRSHRVPLRHDSRR